MTPPLPVSSALIDANVFRVGSANAPSVDVSVSPIIKKWSVSERAALGWSAGVTFQGLTLSNFLPTVGARTHLAFAYRTSYHLKFFASVGVGAHVGMMSNHNGAGVVTELEGIGHLGVMLPPLFGLPEGIVPMIQGIGGIGIFHPESSPLSIVPIYGGGLGVRWMF